MADTKPRPNDVLVAIYAIIISQVITIAELILKKYGIGINMADKVGGQQAYDIMNWGGVAIFLLLLLFICFRHNWARMAYLILTGILVVLSIPGEMIMFGKNTFTAAISAVEMVFMAMGFIFLITKKSADWFKNVKEESADTPPWFR